MSLVRSSVFSQKINSILGGLVSDGDIKFLGSKYFKGAYLALFY